MLLPPASLILALLRLLKMNSVFIHKDSEPHDLDLDSYEVLTKQLPYFQILTEDDIQNLKRSTFKTLIVSCGVPKSMFSDKKYFQMSHYSWLIAPCSDQTIVEPPVLRWDSLYFEIVNINGSNFNVEEIYTVKKSHTFRNILGSWDNQNEKLTVEEPVMWKRRKDLKNMTISVTGLPFAGSIILGKKPGDKVTGSMAELMYTLASSLNVNLEWNFLPRDQMRFGHGSKSKNGSWTGTLGLLERQEVDVVATGMFLNEQRMEVSEYVMLPYHTKITLIMLDPSKAGTQSKQVNLTAFVAIFSPAAWALVFAAIVVLIILHYIYVNIFVTSETLFDFANRLLTSVAYVFLMYSPDGYLENARMLKMKLYFMAASFFVMVSLVHYESELTSYMTAGSKVNFRSYSEVFEAGYKLRLYGKYSIGYRDLLEAPEGSGKNRIFIEQVKDNPDIFVKGYDEIKEMMLEDPMIVLSHTEYTYREDDRFLPLTGLDDIMVRYIGLALDKDSEFEELFKLAVAEMGDGGLLEFIWHKWIGGREPKGDYGCDVHEAQSLGYDNLSLPSLILSIGGLLALFSVIVEKLAKVRRPI